jgi:hypothetical protein
MTFDWNANWPFLLQVTLLGMGLQKPISKWIPNGWALRLLYLLDNDDTRVILTQPLHHRMPVLRNVSRDLQARRTSYLDKLADPGPTCLQVDLHAKIATKMCKNFNESKTPHICWLQWYLEYEWGFPRVRWKKTAASELSFSGNDKRYLRIYLRVEYGYNFLITDGNEIQVFWNYFKEKA